MAKTTKKRKKPKKSKNPDVVPLDVAAIRKQIADAFNVLDDEGRKVGNATFGVYAFLDYDGEPIYVGQTKEMLRSRIGRHLTNQRTDPVAMNVLDPFEVAEIEMWPLYWLQGRKKSDPEAKAFLNASEYTVFQLVLQKSTFHAVLNEKDIAAKELVKLPKSHRVKIIPEDLYAQRKHADIRIARRASTIANLARVISERDVSKGLRKTLVTQAKRLEKLASDRFNEIGGDIPIAEPGEEE